MPYDNLQTMHDIAADLLADYLKLWDRLLVITGDTAHVPYGQLPAVNRLTVTADMPPSSRLTCDVAMGFLAAYVLTDDQQRLHTGCKLLRHAFSRQHPHGWFVWNYGQHEIDQVDLGTVLDTYHYFLTLAGDKLPDDIRIGIRHSTQRAIAYLATAEQPQHPGIIQKRAPDPDHPTAKTTAQYQSIDVINGNALAATAWCRAATILEDEAMFDRAARFQRNIIESFGRYQSGWWSYVEIGRAHV